MSFHKSVYVHRTVNVQLNYSSKVVDGRSTGRRRASIYLYQKSSLFTGCWCSATFFLKMSIRYQTNDINQYHALVCAELKLTSGPFAIKIKIERVKSGFIELMRTYHTALVYGR